jgi:hypothetical protein
MSRASIQTPPLLCPSDIRPAFTLFDALFSCSQSRPRAGSCATSSCCCPTGPLLDIILRMLYHCLDDTAGLVRRLKLSHHSETPAQRWFLSNARSAQVRTSLHANRPNHHRVGVWRCLDQEETRPASQPVPRSGVYLHRLHDNFSRHRLQVPYSTFDCRCSVVGDGPAFLQLRFEAWEPTN